MPRAPRESASRIVRTRRPPRRVRPDRAASPARPPSADDAGPIAATTGRWPAWRRPSRYSVMALTEPEEGNRIIAGTRPPSPLPAAPLSAASTTSAPASRSAGAIRLGRVLGARQQHEAAAQRPAQHAARGCAAPPSASRSCGQRHGQRLGRGAARRTPITASRALAQHPAAVGRGDRAGHPEAPAVPVGVGADRRLAAAAQRAQEGPLGPHGQRRRRVAQDRVEPGRQRVAGAALDPQRPLADRRGELLDRERHGVGRPRRPAGSARRRPARSRRTAPRAACAAGCRRSRAGRGRRGPAAARRAGPAGAATTCRPWRRPAGRRSSG